MTGCEGGDDRLRVAQARMQVELLLHALGHLPAGLPALLAALEPGDAVEVAERIVDACSDVLQAADPAYTTHRRALADVAGIVRGAGASDDAAAGWEALLRISDVLDRTQVTGGAS